MSDLDELIWLDATAQADRVRRGEVKPVELVDAVIARIEHLNPQLNAVVAPMYERARDAASRQLSKGPFAGVPFLLKDLVATYAGVPLTLGSTCLQRFVPDHDSELVARYKRAGLIVVGKTNTPEFGLLPTTEPQLFGATHNPWDVSRTPGGSSGGSAAAVAAGLVPMAHANDGGGSIRIPASCCGVFGFKPTRGRNPLGPDYGDIMSGIVAEHAITRSVRDSAALLDATAGPAVGDPYCAPAASGLFLEDLGIDPGPLRIALTTKTFAGAAVHPNCVTAVQDAAALCAELGHEIVEAAPKVAEEAMLQTFLVLWSSGCASILDGIARATQATPQLDWVEPLTWSLYQMGNQVSASDYLLAVQAAQKLARQIGEFFLDYDIVLTPTLAEPPVPLGSFDTPPDNPLQGFYRAVEFTPFTAICNITGQPAMSVPLFWNADGIPIGSQFIGRFGGESTLFRLAGQLERARPWADRRPPCGLNSWREKAKVAYSPVPYKLSR